MTNCEILLGSQVVDGFFTVAGLSEELMLEWAVQGYLCRPGFLVVFPAIMRVYLRKDIFLGKEHYNVTAIFSYLSLID